MNPEDCPNVVTEGGPWDGWWFTRKQIDDNQKAAARMGYHPHSYAGTARNYLPTGRYRECPVPKQGTGQVYRWSP